MAKIKPKTIPLFILAIVTIIFWVLIWSKVLVQEPGGWFSNCPNCWGDWSAHLTYVSSFAYGHNWPLQLPVFSGHKFTYPFLIDLLSAGLVKLGLDLPTSLVWPGLIFSIILTYLVYLLGKTLTNNHKVGIFTASLFLFNAGWGADSRWLNFITSQIIPQRGQLLGLSLSIIIYLLLWRKKILAAGIIAGLLPLAHAHSYLITMMIGVWYGWRFLLPALALGLPQIGFVYGWGGRNFIHYDTGWLKEWWRLGPMLPLLLWGLISAPPKLKRFSLAFWLVFVLGNCLRFQPYDWDNTKLFLHWYLIASIGAALVLVRWKLVGLIILLISIFPGVSQVSKIFQSSTKYQFFNQTQLTVAEAVREVIEPQAVVLTAGNHNHWLPALTGRQIIMGYPGWLWTYGIDYLPREANVAKLYQGNDQLLDQYQVDYVVIGPDEKNMWPDLNEAYFNA
ncbi:MAG: hypothetical protein U1C50_01135, partial [Patescibacteria group bacterium]|nr:hypothetical protein [Patescibacteria group bacterium]